MQSVVEQPIVLFTSWQGLFYSDNPRALSEQLCDREVPLERVWVVGEHTGPVPADVRTVRRGSSAHHVALERARFIVSNDTIHDAFVKAPGARYVQTWHGTPLKRIAFDVENAVFEDADTYPAELARDVARWDYLLSPNRWATDVLRRAFRYEGEVLETGYPRNDLLFCAGRESIRARVRRELGLADGTRVILYAPTWRDGEEFAVALDLARVAQGLGDDHAVLLRAHWHAYASRDARRIAGVRDVTDHQDLRELYLAADVLVTDYSSAMFDFALTGKPMLFFTHDLRRYRDELRGFYFDLEAHAPGPLLERDADLVDALADLDAVAAAHAGAYERFRVRFCDLDDGRAGARVLATVFGLAP
jgi:CDP-glycerol glycerophosphotransferase